MTCARTRDRLSAWLEGELGDSERARVRAHLTDCEGCRGELDGLKRTVEQLRQLEQGEAPAHLANRVIARLRDGEGQPGWRDDLAAWFAGLDLRATALALSLGALAALAVLRIAAPDPLRDAEALRAALRDGTAEVPQLEIGPRFGAGAAPETAGSGPLGSDEDALLDSALEDPTALLRYWRGLDPAGRDELTQRLTARAGERDDAAALAAVLREIGADADRLAERLEALEPHVPAF